MRYPGGLIATTPVNQQYPSGVWTGPQVTPYQTNNVWGNDTSFKSTTLLLHGDGATTPFIKDASTNNFQIALNGDTQPNNLTPFIPNGYWSNFFNGSSGYLTMPDNAAYVLSGDFTVEAWIYATSFGGTNGNIVLSQWPGGTATNQSFQFYVNSTGKVALVYGIGATNAAVAGTSLSCSLNTWTHVAVTRSGTTVRFFVNGALDTTTATLSGSFNDSNGVMTVGRINATDSGYFSGYISNCRLVVGTALYTSAFTPSTTPLTAVSGTQVLTCQSNRFVDNSALVAAITVGGSPSVSMQQPFTAPSGTSLYGSGYFDGSGDYLSANASGGAFLMSGDWTLSCWIYPSTVSGVHVLIDTRKGSSSGSPVFYTNGSNLVIDTGAASVVSAGTIVINQWQHIAATRSGNSWRLYLNGAQIGSTTTNTTTYSTEYGVWIGNSFYSEFYSGYMVDAQVVNGTALYTGTTYTIPTAPATPVTNTKLLTLQTNGPANNNGFLDSSINSLPITRNGNPTQGSLNPYQTTGYWSNAFDGSGDYLTIPSSSTFSFSGDFTWEAWVYLPVTTSGTEIVSKHVSGVTGWYSLSINSSLLVNFTIWNSSNTSNNAVTSNALTVGAWNHIAGGRNGSTVFACLNGSYASVALTVTPRTTDAVVTIGINSGGSGSSLNGYLSNLRCVSAAVYTGNYTVPTTPLTAITNTQLLTCQSNRFKDNSGNSVALTASGNASVQNFQPFTLPALQYTPQVFGGSGYFDGSGDGVTSANNIGFAFGTGDFTYEAYYYSLDTGASQRGMFDTRVNSSSTAGVLMREDSSGFLVYINGGTLFTASGRVPYTWQHIALVRNSGTIRLYVNGVQANSAANSTNFTDPNCRISGFIDTQASPYGYYGYIGSARVIKGTCLYPSGTTFTPPTAPLTPVTNTQLLLSMTNAAIFDNSGMNNLETVGNAQIDTSVVKYGTSSMYFDGTGDYLQAPNNPNFQIGSGNFTIEMWLYIPSLPSAYKRVFGVTNPTISAATDESVNFEITNGNKMGGTVVVSSTYYSVTDTSDIPTNVWAHWALVRNGSSLILYRNGVSVSTTSISGSSNWGSGFNLYVGRWVSSSARDYNGYIDDLRITKGVARYVGNFTPPVARMPNQ